MHFRRSAALAAAVAALVTGCKEVDQEASPAEVIVSPYASPLVPSPNDVALASSPKLPAGAQRALLQAFVKGGGFPSDQAVSITVPFVRYRLDASGARYVPAAAVLDPATLTTHTVAVMRVDGGAVVDELWAFDPVNSTTVTIYDPATLAPVGTYWNLALVRPAVAGSRRWPTGRYAFAVRGGPSGVKTVDGKAVGPDTAVGFALAAGASGDLSNPQHVPIGTSDDKRALLETVRKTLFLPLSWTTAVDPATGTGLWNAAASASVVPVATALRGRFPSAELATFATFSIAPAPTATVPVDSGSGIAPLPLDLLRVGPADASGQKTIAFNPSFGSAAAGLTSLNGFSTTAMIFAQVVGLPVNAATVNGANVQLYRLPPGGTPVLVPEFKAALAAGGPTAAHQAGYVAEPTPITTTTCGSFTGACSTLIALQPAAGLGTNPLAPLPGGPYALPPLDEETDYAVVVTTGVQHISTPTIAAGPLARSSFAKILVDPGFDPIATSTADTGIALIPGMPAGSANVTAVAVAKMRAQLKPVMALRGRTDDVVLAWTFRTQSVKGASKQLAALPYLRGAGVASADPEAVVTFSAAAITAQHGVPAAVPVPAAAFTEFAEVKIETVNLQLGAAGRLANSGFMDPSNPTTELVTALVAVPARGLVTGACPAALQAAYAAAGVTNCAPLVVYEHGIRQSKTHLLPIAAALAQRGFIVAGIDQAMQGDRAYCSGSGATLADAQAAANPMCCGAATCPNPCAFKDNLTTAADVAADGTPIRIGVCEAGGVRTRPLTLRYDGAGPSAKGIAVNSGNRLLTLNFFRLRDAFRQDVVDQSALVKALAPMGPGSDAFATHLAGYGIGVDPTKIYFVGHSGGAINSTMTLAVNPRVTRGAVYAPGATFVDIASNPESSFNGLLMSLLPPTTTSADLLKLLQIAKWILDPSEAANYAPYVTGGVKTTLASPLPFPVPATRSVLTQFSVCDGTVPNTQNLLYAGLLGHTLPANPGTAGTGPLQWFSQTNAGACPADRVSHGNVIDYATPSLTAQAQSNIASFLADPTGTFVTPVTP